MTFKQIYTKNDFLKAIPIGNLVSYNYITEMVECSVPTARKYLRQLEKEGKILLFTLSIWYVHLSYYHSLNIENV